jgi:hypothetical protein
MARYNYEHTPCDTFVAAFDDKTGEERTSAQMDAMIHGMREVANRYGFDLNVWGGWVAMAKVLSNG